MYPWPAHVSKSASCISLLGVVIKDMRHHTRPSSKAFEHSWILWWTSSKFSVLSFISVILIGAHRSDGFQSSGGDAASNFHIVCICERDLAIHTCFLSSVSDSDRRGWSREWHLWAGLGLARPCWRTCRIGLGGEHGQKSLKNSLIRVFDIHFQWLIVKSATLGKK